MRGAKKYSAAVLAVGLVGMAVALAGCRTTTQSGLPDHIRTVEVHIFENKTMYKGLEGQVTRRIIDRINGDPRIKVVSRGGDAVITGEIVSVRRRTLRETTTNEPGTVLIVIDATYSLWDEGSRRYIIEDAKVSSDVTGMTPALQEVSRGESLDKAERGAAAALGEEIVRRTIGMW